MYSIGLYNCAGLYCCPLELDGTWGELVVPRGPIGPWGPWAHGAQWAHWAHEAQGPTVPIGLKPAGGRPSGRRQRPPGEAAGGARRRSGGRRQAGGRANGRNKSELVTNSLSDKQTGLLVQSRLPVERTDMFPGQQEDIFGEPEEMSPCPNKEHV